MGINAQERGWNEDVGVTGTTPRVSHTGEYVRGEEKGAKSRMLENIEGAGKEESKAGGKGPKKGGERGRETERENVSQHFESPVTSSATALYASKWRLCQGAWQ